VRTASYALLSLGGALGVIASALIASGLSHRVGQVGKMFGDWSAVLGAFAGFLAVVLLAVGGGLLLGARSRPAPPPEPEPVPDPKLR